MGGNRYVTKICEGCPSNLYDVDSRTRFCRPCVLVRHAAAMQRADVRAKIAEAETKKFAALIDKELANPTRYWETPF